MPTAAAPATPNAGQPNQQANSPASSDSAQREVTRVATNASAWLYVPLIRNNIDDRTCHYCHRTAVYIVSPDERIEGSAPAPDWGESPQVEDVCNLHYDLYYHATPVVGQIIPTPIEDNGGGDNGD